MTASDSRYSGLETEQPRAGNTGRSEAVTNGRGRPGMGKRATPISHASGRNARGVSVTIHDIQRLVASRMGATALDLVSARQASARPRQVAMWLARHTTPASFPAIGRAFGNRDHTTVMQACRRVDALMAADPAFAAVVSELRGAVV